MASLPGWENEAIASTCRGLPAYEICIDSSFSQFKMVHITLNELLLG